MSTTDIWFAWHPVQTGALGTGEWIWLRRVWRNRTKFGGTIVTIYQKLPIGNYDAEGNYRDAA